MSPFSAIVIYYCMGFLLTAVIIASERHKDPLSENADYLLVWAMLPLIWLPVIVYGVAVAFYRILIKGE
jgi:hypothetical protein